MALRVRSLCSTASALPAVDSRGASAHRSEFASCNTQFFRGGLATFAESTPSLPHAACPAGASPRRRVGRQAGNRDGTALEYEDMSHATFYNRVRCGKKMKGDFKRMKSLLKESKKKLSLIASASAQQAATIDPPTSESNDTSGSPEIFMNQVLQQLDEINSHLKYLSEQSKMYKNDTSSSSSSSSSSESSSSGSDVDVRVRGMARRKGLGRHAASVIDSVTSTHPLPLLTGPSDFKSDVNPQQAGLQVHAQSESNLTKVEVCMGGKCRRSGASQILSALEDKAREGAPIMPSPCGKCMGKCKTAPNLKVRQMDGSLPTTIHGLVSVNELNMILEEHGVPSLQHPVPIHQ